MWLPRPFRFYGHPSLHLEIFAGLTPILNIGVLTAQAIVMVTEQLIILVLLPYIKCGSLVLVKVTRDQQKDEDSKFK